MNNEQNHTPAPWYINDLWPFMVWSRQGRIATTIVDVAYTDEDVANARLIAAAPDLLEALKGMFGECGAVGSPSIWAMEAARLAIAKATGNQPVTEPNLTGYTQAEQNCPGCMGPCGQCYIKPVNNSTK